MNDNNEIIESHPGISSIALMDSVRVARVASFLPAPERNALYDAACTNQAAFQQPGVPGSDIGSSLYLSMESNGVDHAAAAPVRAACENLSKRVLEILPSLFTTLDVEPFVVSEMPLTLVNGLDGHYGLPHADSLDGRFRISLLYYFHRQPRAFRGGDLKFYEANPSLPNGYNEEALVRIDQEDNVLLAFPSYVYHGITNVECDSNDFADGRFAAISFLGG